MDYQAEFKSLNEGIGEVKAAIGEVKNLKDAVSDLQVQMQKIGGQKSVGMDAETKEMILNMQGKSQSVANAPSGGYLAAPVFAHEVIKQVYEKSPLLSEITVDHIEGNIGVYPVEDEAAEAYWVGELEGVPDSEAKFGAVNINVNTLACDIPITNMLLKSANTANIETFLTESAVRKFDRAVGKAIISGSGHNAPEGVLNCSKVKSVKSGDASKITTDSLFNILGAVPSEVADDCIWAMSRSTFVECAKVFGKDSSYVNMGMGNGFPAMLLGHRVVFADMPEVKAGNTPITFGSFRTAVRGVQVDALEYQKNTTGRSTARTTVFEFTQYFGSAVVRPEAIVKMTIGA